MVRITRKGKKGNPQRGGLENVSDTYGGPQPRVARPANMAIPLARQGHCDSWS